MTNLTEQWKKGELPEGLYWVKHDGVINILDNIEISLTNVEQILDKVPSYDELQNMNEAVNECMSANIKLVEQNKQLKTENKWYSEQLNEAVKQYDNLKELLKELKRYFDANGKYYIEKRILLEIYQVLGE